MPLMLGTEMLTNPFCFFSGRAVEVPFEVKAELSRADIGNRESDFRNRPVLARQHQSGLAKPHGFDVAHPAVAGKRLGTRVIRPDAHAGVARQSYDVEAQCSPALASSQWVVTGDFSTVAKGCECGSGFAAPISRIGAAGREFATGWWRQRAWYFACQQNAIAFASVMRLRNGRDQSTGIGMVWTCI